MVDRVRRLFRIEPGEFPLIRTLFLLHFLTIASFTLGKSARDGLFLGEVSARALPLIYLGMAAWTGVAVVAFGRMARGLWSHRVLAGALVIASGALVVFYIGFLYWPEGTAVLFYLWSGAVGVLLVSQFWTVVNELTDSRQARRLFGTIGAGGVAGGLAGGAGASVLVGIVGPEALLLLTAVLHLAAVPLALRSAPAGDARRTDSRATDVDESARLIFRRPYVRQIALLFLMAGMAAAILDYQFKVTIQSSLHGSGEMTAFLGSFYGVQNLIAIFIQLGLTGFILTRFGARAASIALPAGLAVAVVILFGAPGFVAIAGARLYESTLKVSIAGSAWEFLYFPLPDNVRRQARRLVDLVVNRNAEAAAGLLIIAANLTMGGTLLHVTIMLAAVVVAWLILELLMSRAYVRELSSSLRRMVVDVDTKTHNLTETRICSEVNVLLASPYERQVIYAIDLMTQLNRPRLMECVPVLLKHASAAVRVRAIRLAMEQPEIVDLLDIEELLHDSDPEVAIHAALFFSRLRPGTTIENMSDLLVSDDPVLRSIAFQVVAEHSSASEDAGVEAIARELSARGNVSDRKAIASASGRRPAPTRLHHWIPKLLCDPEPAVRLAAIRSAGQVGRRDFIPGLIERLVERADRDAARTALASFGERVTGTLGDYLVDPTVDLRVKRELPRVLAMIGTQDAADNLIRASMPKDDFALGFQVLKAMNRIRNSNPAVIMPAAAISPQIRAEAEHLTLLLVHGRTLAETPASPARHLMLLAMAEKREAALDRLFRRIALLYPPRDVRLAYVGITRDNPRVRAQSVEFIESVLAPDERRLVLPLIDSLPENERVNNASAAFHMKSLPVDESVREIASLGDSWLTACAFYLAGTLGLTALTDLVRSSLNHPEIIVRDTAAWASARLGV